MDKTTDNPFNPGTEWELVVDENGSHILAMGKDGCLYKWDKALHKFTVFNDEFETAVRRIRKDIQPLGGEGYRIEYDQSDTT